MAVAYASGDRGKSSELFRHVLKQKPKDIECWIELAQQLETVDAAQAVDAYQQASKLLIDYGEVSLPLLNNLAALLHYTGDLEGAEKSYERARELCASNVAVISEDISLAISYNLARLHEERGQLDRAVEAYQEILQKHPQCTDGTPLHSLIL